MLLVKAFHPPIEFFTSGVGDSARLYLSIIYFCMHAILAMPMQVSFVAGLVA